MSPEELERHSIAFRRAYARFPALSEERRVKWAEKIAGSITLQLIYSTTGPLLSGPYFPEDFKDDKEPLR